MSELIKLGVAADYPVHWTFERILRDLIQNFYDSIGYEHFGKEFHYEYHKDDDWGEYQLTMSTEGHPFHYEWLIYIGGSTKTGKPEQYAGKYGEGFKICMLSLMKLGITDITMHSQDWQIHPCLYEERIDGTPVSMVGYRYEMVEADNQTTLVIRGIPPENRNDLEEGLLHFFYPENPLFGEKLGEGETYILYRGNGTPVPCRQDLTFSGILYLNYLARGRLSLPFFVMLTDKDPENTDSRKRKILPQYRVWENMYRLARRMSPEDSLNFLIALQKKWNDLPESKDDFKTWYYVICQLVRNVASSEEQATRFREAYPELRYIDRKTTDRKQNQRIQQTRIWARENHLRNLVNPVFRLLGAVSLVEQYQNSERSVYQRPDATQKVLIELLYGLYQQVVPASMQIELPDVYIYAADLKQQQPDPLRFADSDFTGCTRKKYQKYVLRWIVLCDTDFAEDAFDETFVKFLDILFHAFGSSRSERMNVLFTNLGGWLIEGSAFIRDAREKWKDLAHLPEAPDTACAMLPHTPEDAF